MAQKAFRVLHDGYGGRTYIPRVPLALAWGALAALTANMIGAVLTAVLIGLSLVIAGILLWDTPLWGEV